MKKYIIRLIDGKSQATLKKWKLKKDQNYIIGRSDKVDICIPEDSVSRKHAEISILEDSATIKDLGSANGTFIDDKVAKQNQIIFLKNGTKVYLGDSPNYLQVREKERKSKVSEESLEKEEEEEQQEVTIKDKKKKKKEQESDEEIEEKPEKVKSKKNKKDKEQKEDRERSRSYEKEKEKPKAVVIPPTVQKESAPVVYKSTATAQEKRKLLWGNKKTENLDTKAQIYGKVEANAEETNKFFKLMGFKQSVDGKSQSTGAQNFFIKKSGSEKQTMINDLENQFNEGMKRKSGGKGGLGFN